MGRSVNEVQRHYYRDTSAGATFDARLAAIRGVLVPGSGIVDIGCNDGRMSLALLSSGHASRATGIDLENIVDGEDPRFSFIAADLRQTGASPVPETDAILCLNVLHHLLPMGSAFVQRFVADLLHRAETVLVDLGSLTERGPWPWRQLMARLWSSDEEVAAELFAAARWRRPLCVYRAQNGRRVLWKLSAHAPSGYTLELEQRYRRTMGSIPELKRLIPVADETTLPPDCTPEVIFSKLKRRETEERFWGKRYLGIRAVDWRRDAEQSVIDSLRGANTAALLPIDTRDDLGLLYPFDEHLFAGAAIHYFDRHRLPRRDQRRYEQLAHRIIRSGPFAGLPVGLVADPQAIRTPAGVVFLDLEPSHHYGEIVRYVHAATPAQREAIIGAFYDIHPQLGDDVPAPVRKEVEEALGTDLFRTIARERLRVQRNRSIRDGIAATRSLHPAAALRSALDAARAELQRARRQGPVVRLALRTLLHRGRL